MGKLFKKSLFISFFKILHTLFGNTPKNDDLKDVDNYNGRHDPLKKFLNWGQRKIY
ncbi:MAG: hypothetical protein PHZ07_04125 [Patescibacteria group bacterium]|nr:hypothetical protein [Patescibacteria group bacterium]MDD4304499.1 hypothetical protein [Patescibacteria group bacterium]MDD4694859.1 hypothetical protein [Patescibacteria group bacterium]